MLFCDLYVLLNKLEHASLSLLCVRGRATLAVIFTRLQHLALDNSFIYIHACARVSYGSLEAQLLTAH